MKVTFSGHFLSCPGRIRTHANGTRIRCATVTPQDNSSIAVQSYYFFPKHQNFSRKNLKKNSFHSPKKHEKRCCKGGENLSSCNG